MADAAVDRARDTERPGGSAASLLMPAHKYALALLGFQCLILLLSLPLSRTARDLDGTTAFQPRFIVLNVVIVGVLSALAFFGKLLALRFLTLSVAISCFVAMLQCAFQVANGSP